MAVIKSTSIELKSGMLLSKEILEQMNFQSRLFQVQYDSYPDGIIYGFEFFEEKGILWLSSGLIKCRGKYFFSPDRIDLFHILEEFDSKCSPDFTEHCILGFVPSGKEYVNDGIVSDCLELRLYNREMLDSDDIILAEFQYHYQKREWKSEQVSAFERLEAQLKPKGYIYTFLNVRYSMPYENVFSPYIYSMMKECLKEKENQSDADRIMLFTLCQNKLISLEVLKEWFQSYGFHTDINNRKAMIRDFLQCMQSQTNNIPLYPSVEMSGEVPKKKQRKFGIS